MQLAKPPELAVIKDPFIGCHDQSEPALWFTVKLLGGDSFQRLAWSDAYDVLKKLHIRKVADLEGRTCVVQVSETGIVNFVRMHE